MRRPFWSNADKDVGEPRMTLHTRLCGPLTLRMSGRGNPRLGRAYKAVTGVILFFHQRRRRSPALVCPAMV